MRVCFQYSDEQYLYVTPLDEIADEPLRVRYNIPQINEEFAETCQLLWRHAQLNLLDVAVDEAGILTLRSLSLNRIICLISVHWQNVTVIMDIIRQTISFPVFSR